MMPRWLSWMFIAVLGYMIYASSQHRSDSQPARAVAVPAINEDTYPALAKATDIEGWKRAINPEYAAVMNCSIDRPKNKKFIAPRVIDDVLGEGDDAACGQTIQVQLTVWGDKGTPAFGGETAIALGSREVASGLDAGLVGIKPGGERTLILPPHALARSKESVPHEAIRHALPKETLTIVTVKRLK